MNPIKDEKLFFSPYYDEIAVNEVIQAPRDRGEFVMATDNHILIKVDKSLLKGEYQKAKKPNLALSENQMFKAQELYPTK